MINEGIRVVVALDEQVDRDLVEATLPTTGKVAVTGVIHGLDAGGAVEDSSAQVLLVACSEASANAVGAVESWLAKDSERPVIALCEGASDYFVRVLFEAGADDVVILPEAPERIVFALEKALARRSRRAAEARTQDAPMICVLGPKGGTGKTVTATNLAVSLAAAGARTALVDLDLQFGDIGLALGLRPEKTAYDLATSGGSLDAEKLDAYLIAHESGLRVLLAPMRPDQASAVTPELMRRVYPVLRSSFDAVVVDTPPDFTPNVIAAVDSSSHVCLVGMLDALSLKNTKLGLETLELMGYDPAAVAVVLNRANTNVGLTREDVGVTIGRKPDVLVPSDREVPRTVNEGEPIVIAKKRSPVSAAYRTLAHLYLTDNGAGTADATSEATDEAASHTNGNGRPKRRLSLIRGRG